MSDNFRDVTMPSGAILKVAPAPFGEARELYSALLDSIKAVKYESESEVLDLFKNVVAHTFTNPKLEIALLKCMGRCLYSKDGTSEAVKINGYESFNDPKNRIDYIEVCYEVSKENLTPFGKGLFGVWNRFGTILESIQPSEKGPNQT